MKDSKATERREAEPWHAADEKPAARRSGAPIGTHSLTGGNASVGLPPDDNDAERSGAMDEAAGTAEPDPLAEPRAGAGDLLGRKTRP